MYILLTPYRTTNRRRGTPAHRRSDESLWQPGEDDENASDSDEFTSLIPQREVSATIRESKASDVPVRLPIDDRDIQKAKLDARAPVFTYKEQFPKLGFCGLIDKAYETSRAANHPFFGPKHHKKPLSTWNTWLGEGYEILASIPSILLDALIDDTLSDKMHSQDARHGDLHHLLDAEEPWCLRAQADFAPVIYCRMLVDKSGASPSAQELRVVICRLRQYVSGDQLYDRQNLDIDNASRKRSTAACIRQGFHFHLNGKRERISQIYTFCHALETHLDQYYPAGSVQARFPIKEKFKYFGFSANQKDRSKAHDQGNTNFISSLVGDICKMEARKADRLGQETAFKFEISTYIIAHLKSELECALAEELLTRICNGYYSTGVGFNIAAAGISISGADLGNRLHKDAVALWASCQQFRETDKQFIVRWNDDTDLRRPAYKKWKIARNKPSQTRAKRKSPVDLDKEEALIAEMEGRIKDLVKTNNPNFNRLAEDMRKATDRLIDSCKRAKQAENGG
ncbi:unnamed protein product [Periconia digitata]|uniref:Uncharacterized protein n=1 Tax=Periconia digitata TaxID=1303443 RepID=A0A9W4UP79_9PLEO|nr:unnamed protein product [Periconia digitata]